MKTITKIKDYFGKEFYHIKKSRLEQLKYELEQELSGLQRSHDESPNNQLINELLEAKTRQYDNVSARLANLLRSKNGI